jgi:hypothetical protein
VKLEKRHKNGKAVEINYPNSRKKIAAPLPAAKPLPLQKSGKNQ